MTYNRFLYNTALYNAGRDEVGAVAKSVIQAHTGPHIQAVVAGTSGVTFISDFTVTEGIVKPPPTSYRFPDLHVWLRVVRPGSKNLAANIFGQAYLDLPAAIYPSNRIPDLPASIYGLFQQDLGAIIEGSLAIRDLPAIIQATTSYLAASIVSFYAPDLGGRVIIEQPGNLGARIHSPLDLSAIIGAVNFGDLGAVMDIISVKDLAARVFSQFGKDLFGFVRSIIADTADLPTVVRLSTDPGLPATIFPVPNDLGGTISPKVPSDLGATINFAQPGTPYNLQSIINMIGANNLSGSVTAFPVGERDRFLPVRIGAVGNQPSLAASISASGGIKSLGATLTANSGLSDLSAYLRVGETFVTAILTISTMASRGLRATIGCPGCEGGSANHNLPAYARAQLKGDVAAYIEAYAEHNLGASINSPAIVYAMDTIDVVFSPFRYRFNTLFRATDTIPISFVPFRGKDVGAFIFGELARDDLPAALTIVFPQPRVTPNVNRITAADLRAGQDLNIKDVRLTMEGTFLEYFYVNGTEQAFIRDAYEDWVINIAAFTEIADDLFGDFASSRVRRLGDISSYATLDEAVRAAIQAVLGVSQQNSMGAAITGTGGASGLSANLNTLDYGVNIGDFTARINQVYDDDFGATIIGEL